VPPDPTHRLLPAADSGRWGGLRARRLLRRHRRLVAALLAGWAAFAALTTLRPEPPASLLVAVTARDIAAGALLTPDDLVVRAWPADGLPPGAVPDTGPIVGRHVGGPLPAGTPLTASDLLSPESLSLRLRTEAAGAVALPVRLTDPAAAGLLLPGDVVDVWASRVGADGTASGGPPVAVRVAESARVLGVPRAGSGAGLLASSEPGAVVVLAVLPGAVPALAQAAATSRLTITVLPTEK